MTESAGRLRADRGLGRLLDPVQPAGVARLLDVLDERMKALKDALQQGFGVEPTRVLQTTYEPIQYDETGALCGAQPTLGLDVHPGLQAASRTPEGDRRLPRRVPRPARMHRRQGPQLSRPTWRPARPAPASS